MAIKQGECGLLVTSYYAKSFSSSLTSLWMEVTDKYFLSPPLSHLCLVVSEVVVLYQRLLEVPR